MTNDERLDHNDDDTDLLDLMPTDDEILDVAGARLMEGEHVLAEVCEALWLRRGEAPEDLVQVYAASCRLLHAFFADCAARIIDERRS
jgi:hypothetical protein